MKKIIISTFIGLFLICGLKAQTIISDMPTFEGKDLVLRSEETAAFHTISISDGIEDIYTVGVNRSESHPAKFLADVLGKIKKQSYKLLTSNSGSYGHGSNGNGSNTMITYYIFQKE